MKKSTIIMIFIIYVASIVAIGFFGMKVKIYDEVKYIKRIEMSVEAERDEMYKFELQQKEDETSNDIYKLTIYYTKYAQEGEFLNEETQENETRKYLPLIFIPKILYDTGEEASSADGVTYKLDEDNRNLIDNKAIELKDNGTLICFESKIAFKIYINPISNGKMGSGVIIQVYVR